MLAILDELSNSSAESAFADVNVKWLAKVLADSKWGDAKRCERRARAIYQEAGLIPA